MNINKKEWLLLVAFLVLLTFLLQYLGRAADMSTLTSWRWVFGEAGPARAFLLLLIALPLIVPLAEIDIQEKHPALFLFGLSFFISLPFLNTPEVLLDSSRYFLQAKYLARYGIVAFAREWGGEISPWTDLPLVPFCYGIIFKVFGEHKMAIALFNTVLFSLVPVFTYLTGKLLWDRATGITAGILILASPYLLVQVPLMLVDIHTMFFLLLAVWSFLYGLEQGRAWPFLSAVAIVLALFSKYSTWPMLGVLGIITLFSLPAKPKTIIRRSISTAATTFCFLGIIYLWKGGIIQQQLHFLRTYQMAGLQTWQEGYPSAFFFQSHPFIILAALYGTYRAIRSLDKKILIIGWFAALVFFLELKRVRYLIPLIPFIALTASYGLQAIKNSRFQRYIAYSGVVSSVVIALMVYRPFLAETSMANLKEAGSYLNSLASEAVEVYCLPQANSLGNTAVTVPILDMYTDKIIYQEQSWNSAEGARRAQNVSLRFTWELTQPVYYRDKKYSGKKLPLAVIASAPFIELPGPLLEKYPAAKLRTSFTKTSGIYRYQTFVAVFDPY